MQNFHYVYILTSQSDTKAHYIGITKNLQNRLQKHNYGEVPHTSKQKPWKIKTAIAVNSKEKAIALEKYLKSHSGRAFAKKHF